MGLDLNPRRTGPEAAFGEEDGCYVERVRDAWMAAVKKSSTNAPAQSTELAYLHIQ
jgi:hypothetical protein